MGTSYKGTKRETNALSAFINLVRAAESLESRVHGEAFVGAGHDLSVGQFGVLEALFHLGPLCHKALAEKTLKTGGNVTLVVNNLEKRGLVRRKKGKDDRRIFEVDLTEKGRKVIAPLIGPHVDAIVRQMSVLTQDEQETLRILCRWVGTQSRDR